MHLPYTTMGSGSLAAMGVLETRYRDGLSEQETIDLVKDAIEAGIWHDLGSGSNVDIYVIKRGTCEKKEDYRVYNKKVFSQSDNYKFQKGTAPVLEEIKYLWKNIEVSEEHLMDIC